MKIGVKMHPVSSHTISNTSLPRQLKRPFFIVFRVLTIVYVLAVVVAAVASLMSASRDAFVLTAAIGGAMWVGLAISALANWQTLTVFDDRLLFNSFGKKHTVFYKDVSEVNAQEAGEGYAVPTLTLFLHHEGEAKNPLRINLKLFAASDRVLLMQLIKENGPNADLNALAEKVRRGT